MPANDERYWHILAVIFIEGWISILVLLIFTAIILILWMSAPPGMIIGTRIAGHEGGHPVLVPHSQKDISRAILIFLLFGLLPALALGALLNWILPIIVPVPPAHPGAFHFWGKHY